MKYNKYRSSKLVKKAHSCKELLQIFNNVVKQTGKSVVIEFPSKDNNFEGSAQFSEEGH